MTPKQVYTYINQMSEQKIAAEADAKRWRESYGEVCETALRFSWGEFALGVIIGIVILILAALVLGVHR